MSSTSHTTTPYYFVPGPSRHPAMAALGLFFVILGAGQWINGVEWGKYSLFFGLLKQQTLEPGEKKSWPVAFVIDPKLPRDVKTITLSYTFFEVGSSTPAAPSTPSTPSAPLASLTRPVAGVGS